MTNKRHIHLIGICGTAMASLAGMLKQRGFHVTGSDAAAYPPMSDFLASLDIPLAQPFAAANLEPRPDMVVVGNAISRGNVELEYILDQRIPFCSLPQILHDEFLRGKEVLVVAGTHGKTTTTSMLSWIFHSAGMQPSFLIGGIAENFGSSFQLGQGKHFILEGDEYDTAFFDKGPKFLHYFPDAVILTSVNSITPTSTKILTPWRPHSNAWSTWCRAAAASSLWTRERASSAVWPRLFVR